MRKLIAIFLVILTICGIFAGCGAEEAKPVSVQDSVDAVENNQADEEETPVETEASETITIQETVVYENGGVKVTATGIEEGWTGTEIKLLVENTTDRNIVLSGDNVIVNGVTMPTYLYIDVAAGKKSNGTMSIYSTNLDEAGIEKIATINVKDAHIVDTDSYETLAESPFEVVTSVGADYVQGIDESGDVLFEANGVSVIGKIISDSLLGEEVILFVKNESDKDVTVEAENISVNGFTIDGWMYDTVYAGTVRFCSLDIYSTSLEENGITEVKDISFTIRLIDSHSYSSIAQSDEIQIVVNE